MAFIGVLAGVLIGPKLHNRGPSATAATSPATSPAAISSAAASPTATPAAACRKPGGTAVLAHFTGSGAETTRRFTVPGARQLGAEMVL